MRRLRKFLYLSSAERRLLVKAVLLLGAIRLGLWLLPLQTLRRVVARLTLAPAGPRGADQSSPKQIAWAVEVASRYALGATCLTRALAVQVLFERRGYPARLRIGVAKGEGNRLEAHAWLESRGRVVVSGGELSHYTPLQALEGEPP